MTRLFLDFLVDHAPQAEALYILGDLFEYWAGDDDMDTPHHREVIAAMRGLADEGVAIRVMRGNRDFLMGTDFAQASGAVLVDDPLVVKLHGCSAILTHGDQLCIDDVEYQKFRAMVRAPQWQQQFLALPLEQRKAQIAALRNRSEHEKSYKDAGIMDVNQGAVVSLIRAHNYPSLLIHGHTHRPGRHSLMVDGRSCERIVLADWDITGSYLVCDAEGCCVRSIS